MQVLKKLLEKQSPKIGDKNKFADYIELLCLVSLDKSQSADDIFDRLYDESMGELTELEDLDDTYETTKSALEDKKKAIITNIFKSNIASRSIQLQYYPFEYNDKNPSIQLVENLSKENYFYIALLLCSNLGFIDMPYSSQMPKIFEKITLNFFKLFLPVQAESYHFGTANTDDKLSSGNFYKRLEDLAQKINLKISSKVEKDIESRNRTGERGLDLVGWFKFVDKAPGTIMIFAQCACGDKWEEKQLESHPIRWSNYLEFYNKPINVLFFPHCFRKSDGSWENNVAINETILIDRKRLLELYKDEFGDIIMNEFQSIIDKVISNQVSNFE